MSLKYIDIIMDRLPGPDSQFIEVEDQNGKSTSIGEWITLEDDTFALRIPFPDIQKLEDERTKLIEAVVVSTMTLPSMEMDVKEPKNMTMAVHEYVLSLRRTLDRAERSLKMGGYIDEGGEYWKPPVNKDAFAPRFFQLEADFKEMVARNALLRNRPDLPIERVQGHDVLVNKIRELKDEIIRLNSNISITLNCFCPQRIRERLHLHSELDIAVILTRLINEINRLETEVLP